MSMKIVQFSRPPTPPCPATSRIVQHPRPWMFNFKWTPSPTLQMINNQIKGNIILGWLLHVIMSILYVCFPFQYQLINLVWLSIDFFSFSWSPPRPQSNFKKSKTSFSPPSYSEKMHQQRLYQVSKDALGSSLSWSLTISFFLALHYCVCGCANISRNFFLKKVFRSAHFAINLFYLHDLKT